jgi:hypothetical protein
MSRRVQVKEPPRDGAARRCRYHLMDGVELVGWTNDLAEAEDWVGGFGPVTTAHIIDRRSWAPQA